MSEIAVIRTQLEYARPFIERLVRGLTDDEYLWEPVAGCWSVRREGDGWAFDYAFPEPVPPPFTTIAWRLTHMTGGLYFAASALRGNMADGVLVDEAPPPSGEATAAVHNWRRGFDELLQTMEGARDTDLDREFLLFWGQAATIRSCISGLALHENIHHGAEIGVLRDLYRLVQGHDTIRSSWSLR